MIESKFAGPEGYAAWVGEDGQATKEPAFAWDMAVLLSAYAAGLRVERAVAEAGFRRVSQHLDRYSSANKAGKGYAVLPDQDPPDRYYDDNAWIALAYLDAYEVVPESEWLDKARVAFAFVMKGESNDLGGGVFWHEGKRTTKNTCSNAPAAFAALKLYAATQDRSFLATADRLIAWTKRLQDSDGLYFDHLNLAGGLERTKWTYNTALMIRSHALRHKLARDPADLAEALRLGKAALERWLAPSGAMADEASFAHHLAEAWMDLDPLDARGRWAELARSGVRKAREVGRMPDGLYGLRWDRPEVRNGRRLLLYQASFLRAAYRAVPL